MRSDSVGRGSLHRGWFSLWNSWCEKFFVTTLPPRTFPRRARKLGKNQNQKENEPSESCKKVQLSEECESLAPTIDIRPPAGCEVRRRAGAGSAPAAGRAFRGASLRGAALHPK